MTYVIGGYLHGSLRSVDHKDTPRFRAAQSRRLAHAARAAAAARARAGTGGGVAETGRPGRRQQGAGTRIPVRRSAAAGGGCDDRRGGGEPPPGGGAGPPRAGGPPPRGGGFPTPEPDEARPRPRG